MVKSELKMSGSYLDSTDIGENEQRTGADDSESRIYDENDRRKNFLKLRKRRKF